MFYYTDQVIAVRLLRHMSIHVIYSKPSLSHSASTGLFLVAISRG